jgi:hypothetical protein
MTNQSVFSAEELNHLLGLSGQVGMSRTHSPTATG